MKISVILPVYNNGKHIHHAINSVLKQTYANWELCIVNDGSTDRTEEICSQYASHEDRITFVTQKNQGPAAARNKGLKIATGTYCIFLDSDDFLESNALKALAEGTKKDTYDIVFYGYQQVSHGADGKKLFTENKTAKKEYKTNEQFKKAYAYLDSIYYTHPVWNKMYRLAFIRDYDLHFPKGIYTSEDFIFNLSAYQKAEHLCVLDQILYNYVTDNEDSLTASFKLEKIDSFEEMYLLAYQQMKSWLPEGLNKINSDYIRDISAYVNSLYSDKCLLSHTEKYQLTYGIVNRESVQKCMEEVSPIGARNKLLHTLLKNKNIRMLLFTGLLANIRRKMKNH